MNNCLNAVGKLCSDDGGRGPGSEFATSAYVNDCVSCPRMESSGSGFTRAAGCCPLVRQHLSAPRLARDLYLALVVSFTTPDHDSAWRRSVGRFGAAPRLARILLLVLMVGYADAQLCQETCIGAPQYASDGYCDDGGPGAEYSDCAFGTDCTDCGPRMLPPPPSPPPPPSTPRPSPPPPSPSPPPPPPPPSPSPSPSSP